MLESLLLGWDIEFWSINPFLRKRLKMSEEESNSIDLKKFYDFIFLFVLFSYERKFIYIEDELAFLVVLRRYV